MTCIHSLIHTCYSSFCKHFSSEYCQDFSANSDPSSVKMVNLRDTFVAKYLRIYPTSYKDDMCMRLELYGCPNNIGMCFIIGDQVGISV